MPRPEMTRRHELYPSREMADAVAQYAQEHDQSISSVYKEAIRRMAQDPNHDLEINQ